jgi:N-acetylglutamate synthase-like GNAT family acetyltransferase
MDMEIRYTSELFKSEDVFILYERLDWNRFLKLDQKQILKAMERSWLVIYAYADKELIGTGRVISDGITNAYLCGLGVIQEHRKQGIGTEITKKLVRQCVNNNLHVQFFCEEQLTHFYSKLGFEVFSVGMRPNSFNKLNLKSKYN